MPHTLLLADDSVTIQRVIELTFADEAVRVVAVSNGDQAITLLDESPPDIVLADIGMPGRNGYEVAEHIKRTPRLAHIPIVLLTGAFEPIDQVRATAAGCDAVLTKPFEPQLVIGRVKDLLAKPKLVTPPDASPVMTPATAPWTRTPDDPHTGGAPEIAATSDIDSYFDRLDRAFARLSSASDVEVGAPSVGQPPGARAVTELPGGAGVAPDTSTKPFTVDDDVSGPATRISGLGHGLPPLAEAFRALLEAERHTASPESAPVWPTLTVANAEITDDLVEEVTRRVLERLSDAAMRDTVGDIVTAVAERRVREEIERIKASIT